jgi:hypothetical protein
VGDNIPSAFNEVIAKFSIYRQKWCSTGSALNGSAEVSTLLDDLAFLDRNIIANFNLASQNAVLQMKDFMQLAAIRIPIPRSRGSSQESPSLSETR